jgi:ABC-type dipeptide/oligopeptide/nickel transport system permease component
MTGYVVRRLAILPFTLFVVSFLTFAVARFGPGDPVSVAAGQIRDPEVLARIRAERGLDGSLVEQYGRWFMRAVKGDFGESFIQRGYTVRELILPKMWVSAQLNIISIFFVFLIGIPLGLLAAWFNGKWLDPFIISSLLFLSAIPVLVIIPPVQWLLAVQFNILPVGGWGGLIDVYWIAGVIAIPIPDPHLWLPVTVLTIPGFAGVARLVRVTALQVSTEDYVRTARSKGLKESTIALRHVLPNAMLPLVTVVGLSLADILSGAYFTETLLGIPGIGAFTFESVRSRDYDVILATTLIVATFFIVMNLITDLAYARIDPRVRLGGTVDS